MTRPVIVRPLLGMRRLVPVIDSVRVIAESPLMRNGGTIQVASDGTPLLIVPYVPLQVSRLLPLDPPREDQGEHE